MKDENKFTRLYNSQRDWFISLVGAVAITASSFSLVFLVIAHFMPVFLGFMVTPWAHLLPLLPLVIFALSHWIRLRRRRRLTVK